MMLRRQLRPPPPKPEPGPPPLTFPQVQFKIVYEKRMWDIPNDRWGEWTEVTQEEFERATLGGRERGTDYRFRRTPITEEEYRRRRVGRPTPIPQVPVRI